MLNLISELESNKYTAFSGYASVFNMKDSQKDVILKGAFKKSLSNKRTVPLLLEHNQGHVIGHVNAQEDERGLYVTGMVNKDIINQASLDNILRNMSIGYQALNYTVKDGIRYIKEIALHEVSIVSTPANNKARVYSVRS